MARGLLIGIVFLVSTLPLFAAPVSFYLPDAERDLDVPPPSSILGWEVGEWHVRHDQLALYFKELAASSERVQTREIGRTHEQRPLLHTTITSERNFARLDEIMARHQSLIDSPGGAEDFTDLPALVNLGYSVHGNEASGSNASLLVAYHLASAKDGKTAKWLEDLVIIIDPSLNPDGLSRFAIWANMHRGQVAVADPEHREHREGWPNGRTNHYFFDLNRDWLPAQHPESQARLAAFHRWMPHVLGDFHEMGTDSTYFFQPGVPERKNPLTPERNVELTAAFAERHAAALDELGTLYFSEELFDDFYYGKGSTYPDIHGAVGILFEQASARGHVQESKRARGGRLSFPEAIRNQVTTSFSTLKAASELRTELLELRRDFYAEAARMAAADPRRGWLVGESSDPERSARFARLLLRHGIEVHALSAETTQDGKFFRPGSAYVVPTDQAQYRLLLSFFDTITDFEDETFYDVSTWTLPLAFDLEVAALSSLEDIAGPALAQVMVEPHVEDVAGDAVAWAFEWSSYAAPRTLRRLQDAGVEAQVAMAPFGAEVGTGTREFARGTIIVPAGLQTLDATVTEGLIEQAAAEGLEITAITSGLTPTGSDLGSPRFPVLKKAHPAILVGGGVATYEAGEIWHLLDKRFAVETTLLQRSRIAKADLDRYTHLLLVDGDWKKGLKEKEVVKLKKWVRQGGVLVTMKKAAAWAETLFDSKPDEKAARSMPGHNGPRHEGEGEEPPKIERLAYADARPDAAIPLIGGAIFEVELDRTHPLAFGFPRDQLPVFRNSAMLLKMPSDPYVTVAAYSEKPLLSGYASEKNVKRIAETPSLIARRLGSGSVIQMADPPAFRAFWLGTDKLLLNSLFFGSLIENTSDLGREAH